MKMILFLVCVCVLSRDFFNRNHFLVTLVTQSWLWPNDDKVPNYVIDPSPKFQIFMTHTGCVIWSIANENLLKYTQNFVDLQGPQFNKCFLMNSSDFQAVKNQKRIVTINFDKWEISHLIKRKLILPSSKLMSAWKTLRLQSPLCLSPSNWYFLLPAANRVARFVENSTGQSHILAWIDFDVTGLLVKTLPGLDWIELNDD